MASDDYGQPGSHIRDHRLPPMTALRCFEAAARLESFSRAADVLHLTHGAVSRAVRLIEDDLGVALFERRSRRVFLTDHGRHLAQAIREGFGLIGRAAQDIRDHDRRGPITLSCEPTLLMRWLIPRLPSFHIAHPDVVIHLVAAGGAVDLGGAIDLAIRRSDFSLPRGVRADPLFEERVGPVCRANMVDRFFDTSGEVSMIRAGALLLHTQTRIEAWSQWTSIAGIALDAPHAQTFEHFYLSLQAASAGIGVAVGPWQLVRDEIDSGMLVAPLGFVTDGSRYLLLSSEAASPRVAMSREAVLSWLHGLA